MIKCSDNKYKCEYCCVECDGQKSEGGQCSCDTTEDLAFDKNRILKEYESATE